MIYGPPTANHPYCVSELGMMSWVAIYRHQVNAGERPEAVIQIIDNMIRDEVLRQAHGRS